MYTILGVNRKVQNIGGQMPFFRVKEMLAVPVLICNRNKKQQQRIIEIQACKFLQIQRLETEIVSPFFISERTLSE